MTELILRIKSGENVDSEIQTVINNLHSYGPINHGDLEMLSYMKLYQPETFARYENTILRLMGLYFKRDLAEECDIRGIVSNIYSKSIAKIHRQNYTPVQANLIENMTSNRLFSFSSATSTGKSHVFRDLILRQDGDMVIVVPSRALINEYFVRTLNIVRDKKVNVLVFPDIINTDMADKNVFILTPERVKDLFKIKDRVNLKTVLFDEAQIADDNDRRGLYFDSIVRRINKNFDSIKMLFAQPYIDNPEAQFSRNYLVGDDDAFNSMAYPYKNVGQVFACIDNNGTFHNFAIDKERLGMRKVSINYDPIEKCIMNKGSVLVYVSKTSIYDGGALRGMSRYVDKLTAIDNEDALKIIHKINVLIGGSSDEQNPEHSDLLSLLNKGIVVHHGSLPLQARFLIEEFVNKGFCRICFATSTLYQGINMPFDIVYLKRFEASKSLLIKNLIGRAGRSTIEPTFDFGQVIVHYGNMSKTRNVLVKQDSISDSSQIDADNEEDDEGLREFKDAIRNNRLNDTYNLTNAQVERLGSISVSDDVKNILDILLANNTSMDIIYNNLDNSLKGQIILSFKNIYKRHIKDRDLSGGEEAVIENALRIFMLQIGGRNLRSIIGSRFSYIANLEEQKRLKKLYGNSSSLYKKAIDVLEPRFTMPADSIPDKDLEKYGMYKRGTKIYQVGYDRVMYDTYDYIDKVWGFCLSDIFYAAFDIYYNKSSDNRAKAMCNYIRYATIDDIEIWLLRYGFSFEDIEWVKPVVQSINEQRIEFKNISDLDEEQLSTISKYLPDSEKH
jgi:superfamily II DNA/RNA helicase